MFRPRFAPRQPPLIECVAETSVCDDVRQIPYEASCADQV